MPRRPPGATTRASSARPRSRSATLRTPNPTVAASNEPSANGSSSMSPSTQVISLDFRVFETERVERPGDDEVDEVLDALGAVVEARREEEDGGTGAAHREHVLEVDRRERRLARHQNQLAILLQRHRSRSLDQVRH